MTPRFEDLQAFSQHTLVRIAYTEWGSRNAPRTVVCVHGLSRNGRDFDGLARHLAQRGMRVVAPDLPGRGRSEWLMHPQDYATPLYLSALIALIARLDVDEVDWVGSSLGGHIGMELAALPGAPIRRLVLNDFGARVGAAALHRISKYLRVERTFDSLDEAEAYFRDIHQHFGALTDAQWRHLTEHSTVQLPDGRYRQHHDPAIATRFVWPLAIDVLLWRLWEQVACPVLIMRGEHSDLLHRTTVRDMQRRGRAADAGLVQAVEIPGCGHAPSLMTEDTIAVVRDFLEAKSIGAVAPNGRARGNDAA